MTMTTMKTLTVRTLLFGMAIAAAAALLAPTASAASSNLFASVAGDATLVNGNGVSSVTHIGSGQCEVTFTSDVSSCAYISTTHNAFSQAIQSYTAGGHLSSSGVYVEVKNQGGGLLDGPFDLAVACNLTGWSFAVVGYTGSGPTATSVYIETKNPGGGLTDGVPFHLAVVCPNAVSTKVLVVRDNGLAKRGSPLTSAFDVSTGNYVFDTNVTLGACTMIGTRGSIDKSVPFNPATIEITPGPASNTSGIQVRELLFFGGNLSNQAFHAAGIC